MLKNEPDILQLIRQDEWMMELLGAVKSLGLPDAWICAGFLRSKIWDILHGFADRTELPDIDVIYFDEKNIAEAAEREAERKLRTLIPHIPWSVKNEARMHIRNNVPAYTSAVDAVAKFPETATALAVRLDSSDQLVLAAPHGVEDVIGLEVKPTPYFVKDKGRMTVYESRIKAKNWQRTWNRLRI